MSPGRVRGRLGLAVAGAALLTVCPWVSGAPRAGAAAPSQPVASAALSLNDWALAGQHVIYSYSGLTAPPSLLKRIRLGQVAGVIFFGNNISSKTQIASVITKFEQAASSSPVKAPLLLEVDQEGGLVRRLPGPPLLSEKQVGQSSNPGHQAATAGTNAGKNLLSAGMNVNLAPVVDFYRQAGDFYDQYQRSYSMSASTAGTLSADFIHAQQATGVAATAKHFPGLASASSTQNTDLRPVTLNDSLTRITSLDELPYKSAIAAGVQIVMPSWASYPNIGSKRPAGLSSKVVQGQLRRSLGFTGVIETDAIGAGGLSHYGGHGNRAILATIAGDDLVLSTGQSVQDGVYITSKLVQAYRNATVNRAAFQASAQRVDDLRSSLPGYPGSAPSACTNDNGGFSWVTVGGVNYYLGAPNNIFPGKAALLKPNENSTTLFIHCNSLTVPQQLLLSNRGLALTSRASSPGGLVTFEPAGNSGNGYASQKWIYAGTNLYTFKNVKTGLYLRVRNSGPIMYQTVTTGHTPTQWNQS